MEGRDDQELDLTQSLKEIKKTVIFDIVTCGYLLVWAYKSGYNNVFDFNFCKLLIFTEIHFERGR